jgi:hypothetical protein
LNEVPLAGDDAVVDPKSPPDGVAAVLPNIPGFGAPNTFVDVVAVDELPNNPPVFEALPAVTKELDTLPDKEEPNTGAGAGFGLPNANAIEDFKQAIN